ncbi:peptide deformylase [Methylomonas sp. BW4-1]|uniref:Peptide deformylase n=1 Tax=Methylomonas defluvii TaxID=3045149 RepID=A0ABU4UCP8_9GAMM|nr:MULTISPECIES: peptide deformylase [unclassified Methylomonas]MDX8127232.1 peptide deformylase [Methylomonas sp. OY6]PKD41600.1 peptide deformylase [Methylomonas sp. Kb3]QBC26506.1 peptide deformylase [Methylomonas sp. LW13]
MSILKILEFPDKRLRNVAAEVDTVDDSIKTLVDNMIETMYAAKGVGLAATQVNVHKRVIVMDVSENKDEPICLINPQIIERDGVEESEEGCLSVPGFFEKVSRAEHIKVKALNRDGESFELEARDLLAVCIQHEMDHLEGKLFVDYLSAFKRNRIKAKLDKIHKSQG